MDESEKLFINTIYKREMKKFVYDEKRTFKRTKMILNLCKYNDIRNYYKKKKLVSSIYLFRNCEILAVVE